MKIAIIDGQGGGIGKALTERVRKSIPDIEIIALGTNATATDQMIKAGASSGATGENAIVIQSQKVDLIAGPIGIIKANAMMGELTPKMAEAIGSSPANKVLLPTNRCGIHVVGIEDTSLSVNLDKAVEAIRQAAGADSPAER